MQRVHHPIFARVYSLCAGAATRVEARDRRDMLEGLRGRVLEVGAGSGINFGFYPAGVGEVVALEPEAHLRARAERAAREAPVAVTVVEGVAEALPFPEASFDAAVTSLVLCSVRDQRRALGEIRRVVRPGGELRFFEHVVARGRVGAALQRACDATFWPLVAGGCHCARDTEAGIVAAGFEIAWLRRSSQRLLGLPLPPTPLIVGRARRPADRAWRLDRR
jgi:ubiquinone/menaquinone biosynthesis C-methylase UbiE